MSAPRPEQDWFEKADQDLEMRGAGLGPGTPLPAMARYHSQQCAREVPEGLLGGALHSLRSAWRGSRP